MLFIPHTRAQAVADAQNELRKAHDAEMAALQTDEHGEQHINDVETARQRLKTALAMPNTFWCCGCKKEETYGTQVCIPAHQILWPRDDGTLATIDYGKTFYLNLCRDCLPAGLEEAIKATITEREFDLIVKNQLIRTTENE